MGQPALVHPMNRENSFRDPELDLRMGIVPQSTVHKLTVTNSNLAILAQLVHISYVKCIKMAFQSVLM